MVHFRYLLKLKQIVSCLLSSMFFVWNFTCEALLDVSSILQAALDRVSEAWLDQIYFSAASDRANLLGFLYKLRSEGVSGSPFSLLEQRLLNPSIVS